MKSFGFCIVLSFFFVDIITLQTSKIRLTNSFTKMFFIGRTSISTNIFFSILLINRWFELGSIPISNLYESFLCIAWVITCLQIQIILSKALISTKFYKIIVAIPLILYFFADFILPTKISVLKPIVPALKSHWLTFHVTAMLLGYAIVIFGCCFALGYLALKKSDKKTLEKSFDELSFQFVATGFPFLTLGLISGAFWANEAWGSFWSWDAKETSALITWCYFAIYLHNHINLPSSQRWNIKKSAYFLSAGFILIWSSYLGVNLLAHGLHTYGFINLLVNLF